MDAMHSVPEPPQRISPTTPWLRCGFYVSFAYVGFVSMMLFFENWLVYHPTAASQHWAAPPHSDIQDVWLTSADGTKLHAWWVGARDSDTAILYCHGNAGNLSHRGGSILKLRRHLGASVLIIDYPGYGKSEGRPSEQGCYQAADAAYEHLINDKKIAASKIICYGGSLGGGVATDLASRKEHRALVLIKTFSSLPDAASDLYWWLPAPKRMLMSNQFDNLSKIRSIHRPVFIAHGTADGLIPHAHGVRLHDAANEPKRFLSMAGSDHNDELPEVFFSELKQFLAKNQ